MAGGAALDPAFFRSAWGRIVGVLTRSDRLGDPSLAEDAVQHALLQAARRWPLARQPAEPLAWLTTVARNHLLDRLRAGERLLPRESLPIADEPSIAAPVPPAPGELNDDELALRLRAAIRRCRCPHRWRWR